MASKASMATFGLLTGAAAALLFLAPSATAAPTTLAYDPGAIFNDTYNDTATALNITSNASQRLLFYLDCQQNDYDYMFVWLPAGMDLAINVETENSIAFRFEPVLKSPEHFRLAQRQVRPQVGEFTVWYNTTTWINGPYYLSIDGPSCPTPSNFYNVTWSATATSAVSDGDNSLSSALDITGGPTVTDTLTETTDQADFFKVTASFTAPAFQYLQVYGPPFNASFYLELYNATGASLPVPQTHEGWDPVTTRSQLGSDGFRFPVPGVYYLRLWSASWTGGAPVLQQGNYSITFAVAEFTPQPNIDLANATTITDNFVKLSDALNASFETTHYFKVLITSPRTLWADAISNQIDIQLRLLNETTTGSHLQQRISSHNFDDLAVPKDHESWNFTATGAQLANGTGWYYIEVKLRSNLPPNGLYNLTFWLNDAPAGSTSAQTFDEDVPLVDFNLQTLFSDLDCTLDSLDPDCTLALSMRAAPPGNVTFTLTGGLLNATPAANWFGSQCRLFNASDAKGLNGTATLCLTFVSRNDAPIAVPSAYTIMDMTEDLPRTAVYVGVWFLDVDTGDFLNLSVTGNDNITVTIDSGSGLANFVPEKDFNGFNNLTFRAHDGTTFVDWPVLFHIYPANDAPEPRGSLPFVTVLEDGVTTVNLNAVNISGLIGPAFTDPDGDPLTYAVVNTELLLRVTVSGPILTIRPAPNVSSRFFFFEIEASDGLASSSRASVRVDVTPVNDPPHIDVAVPTTNPSVAEGASQVFSVSASDPDGETPHYQWFVDGVGQSTATTSAFTFATAVTPELARSVTIRVNVSDAQGTWDEHVWTLLITNTNQAPSVTITAPSTLTFASDVDISFSATASDPDGDTLTWTWTSDKVGLPIGSAQTVTSKLPAGANVITVDVFDGQLHSTVTLTLTITAAPGGGGPGSNTLLIVAAVVVIGGAAGAAFVLSRRKKAP